MIFLRNSFQGSGICLHPFILLLFPDNFYPSLSLWFPVSLRDRRETLDVVRQSVSVGDEIRTGHSHALETVPVDNRVDAPGVCGDIEGAPLLKGRVLAQVPYDDDEIRARVPCVHQSNVRPPLKMEQ